MAIGAWLTWTAMLLAGLTIGFRSPVAWTWLAVSAAAAALQLRKSRIHHHRLLLTDARDRRPTAYECALLAVCGGVVLLGGIGALTPPAAQDALVHHLALPKTYIVTGRLVELPFNYFSYFPAGMEMLYLYALLLGGSGTATLLHFAFGVATAALVVSAGRTLKMTVRARLLAAAAFLTVPTVWMELTWAYVDLTLTFFVTLSVLALVGFRQQDRIEWVIVAGLALGAALSVKFTALALIGLLPVLLLFQVYQRDGALRARQSARVLLALIVPALAVSAPWFIRNVVYTGNPVFPLLVEIIPSRNPGWDVSRAQVLASVLQRYGGGNKHALDYLLTPVKLSFLARYAEPDRYDGIVGPFFLLSVPALMAVRRWSADVRLMLGFSTAFFAIWLVTSQQVRYLLPALPVLALAIAWVLDHPDAWPRLVGAKARLWRAMWALAIVVITANAAVIIYYFERFGYADVFFGRVTSDAYLRGRFDYYRFFEYINAHTPASSRVFLVVASNQPYYLDRDSFSDSVFEDYTLQQIVRTSHDRSEIRHQLRDRRITHLLFRPSILLGAETTPFANEGDRSRFLSFLEADCVRLMEDERFVLFALKDS